MTSAAPPPVARPLPALVLAAATGARSMLPTAALARALVRRGAAPPATGPAAWLARPAVARAFAVLAAGELVGDKLPTAPDRIAPGPLAGRAMLGALVGAAAAQLAGRPRAAGALAGAGAAVAAAHLTYRARRALVRHGGLPDPLVAIAEDLLVLLAVRAAAATADAR